MIKLFFITITSLATISYISALQQKVVCYYNDTSAFRFDVGKFEVNDLKPALDSCTHLIYGYAGIAKDTYQILTLNSDLEISQNNYKKVTFLKKSFPDLKILLSVGGFADGDSPHKYITLLETAENRKAFINSAKTLLTAFDFDGLDLAWQFPTIKHNKTRSGFKLFWHGVKAIFDSGEDDRAEEHKKQFVSLIQELKEAFASNKLILTASILPNVNSTLYYDAKALTDILEHVNLLTYDYNTPSNDPEKADYPAPLYQLTGRDYQDGNVDREVQTWLNAGAASQKLILGVPTFGRVWSLNSNSDLSGTPPVNANGVGPSGISTNEPGLLAYYEICKMIQTPSSNLKKISDPAQRYGSYVFRNADSNGNNGIWIGYEEAATAKAKAAYAVSKNLGGVAISDLTLDDFKGVCGVKYPILNALQ